ncbi:DUF3823 domain-containing protein [Pseudochryseolinea flava]|uniref:DUF3823 domain-containing protein n=1 Tax=Pseudochryseolinea flava TaxID=2059302 RepID=A0A364XYB3_9BACT|nr:DUF3823 domain-containing protein [Pseudochryseolinea flava]RAV99247.1 hypothetical protein DQQ10_20345 [Pseudochryseolinea flava]
MKIFKQYFIGASLLAALASCGELDNYDAPSKKLTGRIVYNGQAINVEKGQVRLQLWEDGWKTKAPINVAIEPDGSFSALLFNGDYKVVIPQNDGPFMKLTNDVTQSDTIALTLRGSTEMDIEVRPYYIPHSATFSTASSKISVNFSIDKVITDANAKDIEYAALYINKTRFVSKGVKLAGGEATISGGSIADLDDVNLEVNIPNIVPAQQYVYAIVAVKVAGVEDLIYTPVQKIEF